ncbi:hypothetical protein SLS56_005684 [Neofusicoccum ribis]|uniref:RRN7-type domain-containing protein n=1 Tax=Neofusicoccum ribis TaxID=45134 RepID=A0ABR3SSV3_9PEZI
MSRNSFKSEPCGIDNCRSKRFHVEDDGFVYCSNGHQKERSTERADDDDAFGTLGRKTKIRRVDDEEQEEGEEGHKEDFLKGEQAFLRYVACYQCILRNQSRWLVSSKGMPADLETIVRDLWSIRIRTLGYNGDESDSDTESSPPEPYSQSGGDAATSSASTGFRTQSEGDTDYDSSQSRLNSQLESDTDTETQRPRRARSRSRTRPNNGLKLVDTLALCYLSMLLLRLPVNLGDIHDWVANGEMVYYRALAETPSRLLDRLPSTYLNRLEPQEVLTPDDLQSAILDLVLKYEVDQGVVFPPLNYPLLVFKYIRDLALPLQVFPTVMSLAHTISCTFTFPDFTTSRRKRTSEMPEAQLAAFIIIAVKHLYPFGGVSSHPAAINWHVWVEEASQFDSIDRTSEKVQWKECLEAEHDDVLSMNDNQLNDYMDWCEAVFSGGSKPEAKNSEGRSTAENSDNDTRSRLKDERLKAVLGSLKFDEVVSKPSYEKFMKVEDLEGVAKAFHEAVAKQAAMSLTSLVKNVTIWERNLGINKYK